MSDLDADQLARQAQSILSSDAYKIAMDKIEAYTIEMWANGSFKTPQEREEAYGLVRGARTFRARLNGLLEDAKLSKAQADTRDRLTRSQGMPAR